jgi:hypothetical protein
VPKSKIFISHSTVDRDIALDISKLLDGSSIETWFASEGVDLGSNFAEKITEALSSSDYLLLILSPSSISSPHVKREVSLAIDRNIPILPILLGQREDFLATLPQEWNYWLAVVQIIPFIDSVQTAQIITDRVLSGRNDFSTFQKKPIAPSRSRLLVSSAMIAFIGFALFLFLSNDKNEGNILVADSLTANETTETNILNDDLLSRLREASSVVWASESSPNSEGLNEESIFTADECYAYIFGQIGDANFATQEMNFTSNAYYSWMNRDDASGKTIIFVATYEDAPCANAAEKAFKWKPLDPNSENFIEAGSSPFERCVLASKRIYGGTNQENIAACKFQFERDGKAIPEDYMNSGR